MRRGDAVLARAAETQRIVSRVISARMRRGELGRELLGLSALGLAALLGLALISHGPGDSLRGQWGEGLEPAGPAGTTAESVRNWVGPVGAWISEGLLDLLGATALGVPLLLLLLSVSLFTRRSTRIRALEGAGFLGVAAALAMLLQLVFPELPFRGRALAGGGLLGEGLVAVLVPRISVAGAWIAGITVLLVSARLAFGVQVADIAAEIGRVGARGAGGAGGVLRAALRGIGRTFTDAWHDWREELELAREERREAREERLREMEERRLDEDLGFAEQAGRHEHERQGEHAVDQGVDREGDREGEHEAERGVDHETEDSVLYSLDAGPDSQDRAPDGSRRLSSGADSEPRSVRTTEPRPSRVRKTEGAPEAVLLGEAAAPTPELPAEPMGTPAPTEPEASGPAEATRVDSMDGATRRGVVHAEIRPRAAAPKPRIHESQPSPQAPPSPVAPAAPASGKNSADALAGRLVSARRLFAERKPFVLPSMDLLEPPPAADRSVDEAELERQAARLEETLRHYQVEGRVTDIRPGPVVTMFEFEPAPGIKVARIANLGDDLAMALRALKVRIVAPIPGKGAVGIEVPSARRETIFLKDLMSSSAFGKPGLQLPLALGKGIDGAPLVADMAKMPHLLVAGTTGSGKSVCVNSIILSLLYGRTPDEVRLILVDPKMLEFSIYEGIPQLLVPVVTSPKKAAVALRWAVEEMGRRYKVLSAMNTRNIVNYNEKATKLQAEWDEWTRAARAGIAREKPECGRPAGEDTVCFRSQGGDPVGAPDRMPYIVIVIDELADLMMVARKEVEESIVRLAQMARAAGIHMLLATQRPSVDVITGLIKANFPTRLSFRVSSKVDSRTVLDANGAESLLGLGDGLFLPPGASDLIRVHGAFVADDEVKRVVDHLKAQGEPDYVEAVLAVPVDEDGEGAGGDGEDDDEAGMDSMYDQAVAVVAEFGKASTSLLQRRLKLGYNRAARIIDRMEREGVVGPADGARPREVYVKPYED